MAIELTHYTDRDRGFDVGISTVIPEQFQEDLGSKASRRGQKRTGGSTKCESFL